MATESYQSDTSRYLRKLKNRYDTLVGEVPWLRAIAPVFSLIGIFIVIIANIPESIFTTENYAFFWPAVFAFFIFLYLLLAAVYANDRLRTERQLRQVESGFHYDSRGTLWNGDEPNIAFRIATFKGVLAGLNSTLRTTDLYNPMIKAGEDAAEDFAKSFSTIYETDIRSKKGGSSWTELPLSKKLHEWAEYDSSTGWGILTTKVENDEIKINVIHLNNLYDGEGGQIFGHFITGYCETVVEEIVKSQNTGRFADCNSVAISTGPIFEDGTVTLKLVME